MVSLPSLYKNYNSGYTKSQEKCVISLYKTFPFIIIVRIILVIKMKFDKLLETREENNLYQKDIANILEVSTGTYAMNEEGHDTITLKNLIKFCDYFNLSLDYIFNFTNNKNYQNQKNNYSQNTLCTRLKEIRKQNKFTQTKIGDALNIDHSVWCRYEQGKTLIPTTFLYEFCKIFHISADYLLGRIDEPINISK